MARQVACLGDPLVNDLVFLGDFHSEPVGLHDVFSKPRNSKARFNILSANCNSFSRLGLRAEVIATLHVY